jgi:ubiquinone/menaquinone biosynthesis C-methylase UbiE
MNLYYSCPICKSEDLRGYSIDVKRKGPHASRVKCNTCKVVFANPMANKDQLIDYYSNYYDKGNLKLLGYKDQVLKKIALKRNSTKRDFFSEMSFLNKYKKGGNILDIGAGLGNSLLFADYPEYKLYATEYDMDAIHFMQTHFNEPVNAFKGDIFEANYPDDYFDLVIFNHVIEHVLNPDKYLNEINRVLKKGGILYIGTPDIEAPIYKIYRTGMIFSNKIPDIIDGIEHTYLFSRATLKKRVMRHCFNIISHKSVKLHGTLGEILRSALTPQKKLARIAQTFFPVNQELICIK